MKDLNRNNQDVMPVLFIGHGSPMNAIEENRFSAAWRELAMEMVKPKAILSISAHWVTSGTCVNNQAEPKTVYDMYGFPRALYEKKYQPAGAPWLADDVMSLFGADVRIDNQWGIDHGTWSVLAHMYPKADVPTIQMSIDAHATMEKHYQTGQRLRELRKHGILILGSGNVVHNLSLIDWDNPKGADWAVEFDRYVKNHILNRNHEKVIHYESAGDAAGKAFRTTEHFAPLPVILGASSPEDDIKIFNEECLMGSLSMTGYRFG